MNAILNPRPGPRPYFLRILNPGLKKGKSQILKNLLRTLNLWRCKIWRLPILHYTPTTQMSTTLLPPVHKLTQLPWLRTLYEVLNEVHAIKIVLTK